MTRWFRFSDWPMRAKMAALVVMAALLPLSIWAVVDLRQDQVRALDAVKDLLGARGDQIVRELDAFHRSYQRAAGRIARFPDTLAFCTEIPRQRVARRAAMLGILAAFPATDDGIRGVALIDAGARVVVATEDGMEGTSLSGLPAVRTALGGTPVITDPYLSPAARGAQPTIAYLAPVFDADRQVVGAAVVWVRAEALWNTVKASDALVGPGSFAVLFDRDGIRIAHTLNDDAVFRPGGRLAPERIDELVAAQRFGVRTRELLENVREFPEQFERARAATPDLAAFRGFAPNSRTWTYGVGRRFETVPWTVFYMVPEAAITAQVDHATRDRILIAALVIAAAAAIGLLFAATILRPLRALARTAEAIAGGDLSARVPPQRNDELGRFGASFNAMAEQIEAHANALQRSRDELERRVRERTAALEDEVAERARAVATLRERDAALHRAQVMNRAAHVITRPDGSFESWSETLPPLAGVLPAQMPKSTREWMNTLLHPEDRPVFRAASLSALRSGARTDVEYRLQRPGGETIHVRQVIEPIPGPVDDAGRTRWFSTLQDISEQKRADDALRRSQALLQAIIDNSAAVIYAKDLDGRYLLVNRLFTQIFQRSADEIVGRTDHELFDKEAADAFRAMDRRVAAANAPLIEEETAPLPDGPHTYVSVKCPLPGDDGGLRGIFGISTDITERQLAEATLRASEERTRLIVDSALDAVITMDEAGAIAGWNAQAEKTFGWTRDEVLGRSLADTIVPPAYRDAHQRGLAHYLATGEGPALNRRLELAALHRDGRELPIELAITPIRTPQGLSFSAFVRDISERRQGEVRLQAQLERLELLDQITRSIGERQDLQSIYQVAIRSIEERLPVDFSCVLSYDGEQDTLSVIRVGVHSQALAMELALGEDAHLTIDRGGLSRCVRGHLVYEPDIAAVPFSFAQRLARGGLRSLVLAPLQSESRVFGVLVAARRRAESFVSAECEFLRQLSAHVALAAQQAQLHSALQLAFDELRQSQQTVMQQERLRALGQMASGIAHDINNAISPVALYTESLLEREQGLSERGRGQLVTIARAIDDVAATVARMREFYRQREPQLLLAPVKLNALVDQVVELTRARWSDMPQQRGAVVTLQTELMPDLPVVRGVESELREALINLLFNAVDAMPEGGTLTLRTRVDAGEGDAPQRVVLEVGDTGVGMDEDTQRRCLEPFFTTKGERGTGLGLAMVYGVAQRHGAQLQIRSVRGGGTTMGMVFPVPAVVGAAPEDAAPAAAPAARLRILLVDDDPLLLRSLRDTLEYDGHVVVTANGGQAGIDTFLAARGGGQSFDIVVTDLGMPHVDGRKVAGAIKQGDGATPVILLTGWGQRIVDDGDQPESVDKVLSKPPKLRELRAALAQLTADRPTSKESP